MLVWAVVGSRQARSGCYVHFKFGARNFLNQACPPRAILLTLCFPMSFKELISYASNKVLGSHVLITHDGWSSGTVGDLTLFFQCNEKRKISLFREIELTWVKVFAIETVVSLIQSDCLWMPWKHKSSADHNGGQPGCKWTSQIWNVAHCLGELDRGHCAYTYDISQIDKLWISPVILMKQLVEKKFYKLLSRSVSCYILDITYGYNVW